MATVNFEWYGGKVGRKVVKATRQAMEETMAACVVDAKQNVPVVTAVLQGSLRMSDPPVEQNGESLRGQWGSFDVNYALAVELGDGSLAGPDSGLPDAPVSGRKNTGNKGFLRGAADKEYPKLGKRAAARFKKL